MTRLRSVRGVPVPTMFYGTAWKEERTAELTERALLCGFRAIDTANQLIHYDEARVGEALLALGEKGIKRDDLFLQTKFTSAGGQDHRTPYDPKADLATQVRQSFESSLAHLHTGHLDSYVLHGPHYRGGLGKEDWVVWAAMEALYESKKTKMIGVRSSKSLRPTGRSRTIPSPLKISTGSPSSLKFTKSTVGNWVSV